MRLETIAIKNFKSITSLDLKFSDNLYCLVGENEIGKSNILQAISQIGKKAFKGSFTDAKYNNLLKGATISATFILVEEEIKSLAGIVNKINGHNSAFDITKLKKLKMIVKKIPRTSTAIRCFSQKDLLISKPYQMLVTGRG
ncbi:AAA family ATPase [Niabella hibiscisoli]|uniref:AAA family ATPase n=1 Tax=Niabella hibiscisoli TaxID=1825928 RepID=UPI001F10375B|nr:AAA family ATPase [Niabella hibiscisoli]MCH5720179.1 AAA family ATPase [Niabella hibiscisoli]